MFRSVLLIFLIGSVQTVHACFGGFGGGDNADGSISDFAITSSPSLELSYYPLVEWTYPPPVASGGTAVTGLLNAGNTLDQATKNAQQTVRAVLIEALVQNNVQITSATQYDVSNMVATEINARGANETTHTAGEGVVESGVVVRKCSAATTPICNEDYTFTRIIRLKNGPLINGKQWKDVGNSFENMLTLRGLKFKDSIIVTE
uniref:Uncharacterized protein n=1 Tax=Panagrolaimus sp. JU765 TaxID=591449 RepID=A0AC34RAY6_9BILA